MFITFELSGLFPGGVYRDNITQIIVEKFVAANYNTDDKDCNTLMLKFAQSPSWSETQIVTFCSENPQKVLENPKYASFFKISNEKVAIVYSGEGGRFEVCVSPLPPYVFWAAVFLELFVQNTNPLKELHASVGH